MQTFFQRLSSYREVILKEKELQFMRDSLEDVRPPANTHLHNQFQQLLNSFKTWPCSTDQLFFRALAIGLSVEYCKWSEKVFQHPAGKDDTFQRHC